MIEIGAYEAKTHLARLLDRVARGERVIITRHGRRIARIVPIGGASREDRRRAVQELKQLREQQMLDGLSARDLIEEGRR